MGWRLLLLFAEKITSVAAQTFHFVWANTQAFGY